MKKFKPIPLPARARAILATAGDVGGLRPRLIRHHEVVHDVAMTIATRLEQEWGLGLDLEEISLGAAIHDIGKLSVPNEIAGPGREHEEIGPLVAESHGFDKKVCQYARFHSRWSSACSTEVLIVALADRIWKGARDSRSNGVEDQVLDRICAKANVREWEVFDKFDTILAKITEGADARLEYCR